MHLQKVFNAIGGRQAFIQNGPIRKSATAGRGLASLLNRNHAAIFELPSDAAFGFSRHIKTMMLVTSAAANSVAIMPQRA